MDWKVAKKLAVDTLEIYEAKMKGGEGFMTILAAMLLVVTGVDDASSDSAANAMRPDNLQQLYGWAAACLVSMAKAFPPEPEKPN